MTRYLITSALPYINGIKHLGNLGGSMLPADVYARFLRQKGEDVLFICATDEHGTPAELAALEKNQDVETFCTEQHEIQKSIYQRFHLSFDHFGRSSSSQNAELTQHFCKKLMENGFIEERTIKQVYSVDDGRFLPDRYIVGTCPHCGYEAARGDQCENCTRVLDPTDLINPRSAVSGSSNLEIKDSKHLFLNLPAMESKLAAFIDEHEAEWPIVVTSIARKWLKEGLRERCITRDLKWGISVPKEGFEGKVFYVWFDAPIEYIGATAEWAEKDPEHRDWKSWWYDAKDVRYTEFMAKDNIPFHTIMFPATLFASGEPWKKVDYIKGFNWLTFYGGKFSTSQKRGIFTNQALDEFQPDFWRYWLMANTPENADSSFTFSSFAATINKDLNDVLGNFVNRVLKMTASKIGAAVPAGGEWTAVEKEFIQTLQKRVTDYTKYLSEMEFRKALTELRAIWVEGNNYLTAAAPWTVIKEDPEKAAMILRLALNVIRLYAVLSAPIIPETAEKIQKLLNLENAGYAWPKADLTEELQTLKAGHAFNVPEQPLFQKITPEAVTDLCARYGGNPDE
ncbi:MAG: methionine--tRNA ligase [Alphaproteobacteria bacterium]|nr:methionine--tRNA ligase [Alphaproteobacteria bacterium]MBO4643010.1 methionine--tRNA ligase [Alphaproteobacteria bacterium]